MKICHLETPEKFMTDLNWTHEELEQAREMLKSQDNADKNWIKSLRNDSRKFFLAQREHLRNSITFWDKN